MLDQADGQLRDIDKDDLTDLVTRYRIFEADLQVGDTLVCLEGRTLLNGLRFEGCTDVQVVPVNPSRVWHAGDPQQLPRRPYRQDGQDVRLVFVAGPLLALKRGLSVLRGVRT